MSVFEDLTEAETELFGHIAVDGVCWRDGLLDMSKELVAGIFSKGKFVEQDDRWGVPMDVHMRWCAWCSEQEASK